MTEYRVFLGLGSNLGERERYLQDAARQLAAIPGTSVVWFSSVFETDPYGNADQPRFLNVAAEITTALAPPALLAELKGIEARLGRTRAERWGPREIDLDILLYEGFVYTDDAVSVPHPELAQRRFVLVPLREIAPDLIHPVSGLTVEEMAAACRDQGRVVKTSFHIRP